MKMIQSRLGIKLFLSYVGIILVGGLALFIALEFSLPRSFTRHMLDMMNTPGMGMGMGMGQPQGQGRGPWRLGGLPPNDATSPFYINFRAGANEAVMWGVLAAGIVAAIVSVVFSRSIVAPLRAMTVASQRIAEGHYDERVQSTSSDELGQLANRFNQMAAQLEQVESMRRRLIGDVTHELRTPLTAIKGSMEGLIDGVLPADAETFQQIHQEADRLNRLVDDLQELSRVEARAYELDIQPVDVSSLIGTVTKRMSHQFGDKRVGLRSNLPAEPMRVLADEDRIVQVLTNLVGNALQYTNADGQVTVAVERVGDEVRFSVRDTGAGIPAEHLPHIFDRFYRVDKSRSRVGGGSGIGLTIAKFLVEAHRGKIWAESEGESKGSVFIFTLPVAKM